MAVLIRRCLLLSSLLTVALLAEAADWLLPLSGRQQYAVQINARGAELTGICIIKTDSVGESRGAIVNEFGIHAMDFTLSADRRKVKLQNVKFEAANGELTYAEAAGPTEKAYELVNFIRNRAGLGDLATGLSKEAFREAVIRERMYELAFEGNITYDLRRTGKLHTVKALAEQGVTSDDDIVFYPIPASETDLNPNIK